MKDGATVIRGVLRVSLQPTANGLQPVIRLLDAAGRKVIELHAGANDVRTLSPGVYFVRQQRSRDGRSGPCQTVQGFEDSSVRKVIVAR